MVDNTNPTLREREIIISRAKENHYKIIGYFFSSSVGEALSRNAKRTGKEKIPEVGILSCYKQLTLPQYAEGFDQLFFVKIAGNEFIVEDWKDEI